MSEVQVGAKCDHVAVAGPGWLRCHGCGSVCTRDRTGMIDTYTRGTADRPPQAQREAERAIALN